MNQDTNYTPTTNDHPRQKDLLLQFLRQNHGATFKDICEKVGDDQALPLWNHQIAGRVSRQMPSDPKGSIRYFAFA